MSSRLFGFVVVVLAVVASWPSPAAEADEDALKKAVTLYASFDKELKADFGGGDLAVSTRSNDPKEKGKSIFEKGFSDKAFKISPKGINGSCLEAVDLAPNSGRIFFPAKGNIAFKKGGWSGALSMWINIDPDKQLKTKFCDPVQITQKGAGNGGIWFDFNDAKPRDLRHGCFPALKEGEKQIPEEDAKAPMVRFPKCGFKQGDWHHVALSWKNFDTGKPDALSQLWIDGKLIGEVKDRAIAMDWDIDQANIYFSIGYIGLLDEFAIFNRPLTPEEITLLHKKPAALAGVKKADAGPALKNDELAKLFQRAPTGAAPVAPRFPFDAAAARRYQEDYAKWLGVPAEFTNERGMTFRLVPPGTFLMGSPDDEPGRSKEYDETRHSVTITRPFYLGKHETTVGQFRRFVEATKYVTDIEKKGGGNAHDAKADWQHRPGTEWRKPGFAGPFELKDDHPVVHVSHTDALNFCRWLQEGSGADLKYNLPTEAQWEWACRAGSGDRYWWGKDEDKTGQVANVGDKTLKKVQPDWPRTIMAMDDGHAFLAPVGSYRANGFGLHDMLGNVWEFCSTNYGAYPKEAVTDPGSIDPKRGFAVRGGGWSNVAADVRCASRNADPPHFGHSNLGFRVKLELPERK